MALKERIKGRPPRDADRTTYFETDLHALLVANMPSFVDRERIVVGKLADAMGYSAYAVYRTLAENRLSPRALNRIITIIDESEDAGGSRLTKDDLLKFLLN